MTKAGKPKDVFDVERIEQIVQLMEQHDLSEVDLQQGDEKIKLCRGSTSPLHAVPAVAPPTIGAQPAHSATTSQASGEADGGTVTINSPMVGTFYARANPDSEPFVKVGDLVNEETVVCIVEAMKVFNEIPAECNGKIVEILISDQQPVDFGKPMFRVEPS